MQVIEKNNNWELFANYLYEDHPKLHKAVSAGKGMDQSLEVVYTKGGISRGGKFLITNWLAYFDYEVLVKNGIQEKLNPTSPSYINYLNNKYNASRN